MDEPGDRKVWVTGIRPTASFALDVGVRFTGLRLATGVANARMAECLIRFAWEEPPGVARFFAPNAESDDDG